MAIPYVPYDGPVVTRAEAKAARLKRYFTGKPCPHGHVVQKSTVNGSCRVCSDLRATACKKAHPDRVRAQVNAWRAANRETRNAREREANKRKPHLHKARIERFHAAHPEARREHYVANAEAIKQRVREWCLAKPEMRRALAIGYRARKANAEGTHTAEDVLRIGEAQGWRCHWCAKPTKRKYHVDHIVPLAKGGSNRPSNLAVSCPTCNHRKNATDPVVFAQRLGLLI